MTSNNPDPVELIIELGAFNKLHISVFRGKKRLSVFSPELTSNLRAIIKQSVTYHMVEDLIINVLKTESDIHVYYKNKQQKILIKWNQNFKLEPCLFFDINDDQVIIKPYSKNVDNFLVLGNSLVVDTKNCLIGIIKQSDGYAMPYNQKDTNSFAVQSLPKRLFEWGVMMFMKTDRLYFHSKELNEWTTITPQIVLTSCEKEIDFCMGNVKQKECLSFDKKLLETCLPHLFDERFMTVSDKVALFQAECLNWIQKNEENPFTNDRFASYVHSFLLESRYYPLIKNDDWYLVKVEGQKQFSILACIIAVFGQYLKFEDETNRIRVDQIIIDKHIGTFINLAKKCGIDVTYNDKKLALFQLDLSLDISDESTWKKAAPTIKGSNMPLNIEVWKERLDNIWLEETSDEIMVLDDATREQIKALIDIFKNDKKEKKIDKDVQDKYKILDWFYLKQLGVDVTFSPKHKNLYHALLSLKEIPAKDVPKNSTGTPRQYQTEGYSWLYFLYEYQFGAILADDMGLGKTLQSILLLAEIKEKKLNKSNDPNLIVVPPSLMFNWHNEIEKFCPALSVQEYSGAGRVLDRSKDVIITTYEMVRRDIALLKEQSFHVVVFDEAQYVKNHIAGRSKAVKQLNAHFKVCLTGTPLENHIGEFFSLVDLALPGLISSLSIPTGHSENEEVSHFLKIIKPFVLRREKNMIFEELPEKIENNVFLDMSKEQTKIYNGLLSETKLSIQSAYKDEPKGKANMLALTAILRLRQICLNPCLMDKSFADVSPKVDYLVEQVQELREEGHSALLFSQFTSFLDIIEKAFITHNVPYLRIDGKTPTIKRKDIIESFQNSPETKFLLMSLKTGGVGLNLTKASYVFHCDPWWNPAVENQASDRAHRIGQTQKVMILKLIMHNSIEEKILALKRKKQKIFDDIMKKDVLKSVNKFTKEDFLFLIGN